MSALDFISLARAQPFRPFRVRTHDGQAFDISLAQQIAISPGLRMIVLAISDSRFEVLVPERIAACELITESTPPIEPPPPPPMMESRLSPGGISFMAFTGKDGRGLVHFAATDADGKPMVSSAGTRWDVHGMEVFENGRTLYIHHADDLTQHRRIILWPPNQATFESFAEAGTAAEIQASLVDQSGEFKSLGFEGPKGYIKSITPDDPYVPPMPKYSKRGDPEDPARFELEMHEYEAAPGDTATAPILTDFITEYEMLDLTESGWDVDIDGETPAWELTLRHVTDRARTLKLGIDAFKGEAIVQGKRLSLEVAERHLRNFPLHNSWDMLQELLTGEPRDLSIPEVEFRHKDGVTLELWPGKKKIVPPFLVPRIIDAGGRCILDARGSQWGALVRPSNAGISLHFIHAETESRFAFEPRLLINPFSHRITSDQIPGSTCIAVLQKAIQDCRTPEWLLEELQERFAQGRELPLPS